jgi:hypothetical protein
MVAPMEQIMSAALYQDISAMQSQDKPPPSGVNKMCVLDLSDYFILI